MNFSALSPPNSSALSDVVIGSVMQRSTWNTRTRPSPQGGDPTYCVSPYQQRLKRPSCRQAPYQPVIKRETSDSTEKLRHYPVDASKGTMLLSSVAALAKQTDILSDRRRASCLLSDLKTVNSIMVGIQGADHHITPVLQNAIVAEALKKKIRHRERCRINQARYRERQLKIETEIEDAIVELKTEIQKLESMSKTAVHLPTTPTNWALASEYFRQLNYFISSPRTLTETASQFLRSIMAPDAIVESKNGADALLERWTRFALLFNAVRVDLKGLTTPTPDTLVADAVAVVTITDNTLQRAFPHLNTDGAGGTNGGTWLPVAAKLANQNLSIRSSVFFGWDNCTGKVVRVHSQTDLMSPMLSLLGNIAEVSHVFSKALITPDCKFVKKD